MESILPLSILGAQNPSLNNIKSNKFENPLYFDFQRGICKTLLDNKGCKEV